jgi:hypothetical protein
MKLPSAYSRSTLLLLCVICSLFGLIYYYSGRAHDSSNILLGSFIDSQEGVGDRSFVVSLVLFPFITLGANYGFLLYLLTSTFLLYHFTSMGFKQAPRSLRYILFFPFLPVFLFPVLLPGKESVVFFIIYYIYSSDAFSSRTVKLVPLSLHRQFDIYLRIILLVIAYLVRPNIILLTPMILFSMLILRRSALASRAPGLPIYLASKMRILLFFLYCALLLFLVLLNLDFLSDALIGIYKLSSYDASGNSSHANFIHSDLVSQSNLALYALGASAIGFPLAQGLPMNIYACLIGIISVFPSYVVYISASKMLAKGVAAYKIQLTILCYVFALFFAVLGSLFASVAFLANAGTGARYFLVYTQVILLSYISLKSHSNEIGSVFVGAGKSISASSRRQAVDA